MWKAGQIVTVRGKKYRVKSELCGFLPCTQCALDCCVDANCDSICFSKEHKLDGDQYLEEIPTKKDYVEARSVSRN